MDKIENKKYVLKYKMSQKSHQLSKVISDQVLTIETVRQKDFGTYACVVRNSLGEVTVFMCDHSNVDY